MPLEFYLQPFFASLVTAFGFLCFAIGIEFEGGFGAGAAIGFLSFCGGISWLVIWFISSRETKRQWLDFEKRRIEEEESARRESLRTRRGMDEKIICPQCHSAGCVRTRPMVEDGGLSGQKMATAAITSGISILFDGLSNNRQITEAKCSNCGSVWRF